MLECFYHLFDDNVYKANLVMVKNNEYGVPSENVVLEVMVEKTASSNYVREIITGRLISVKKVLLYDFSNISFGYDDCMSEVKIKTLKMADGPVYVIMGYDTKTFLNRYFYKGNFFECLSDCKVSGMELYDYMVENMDVIEWDKKLDEIFREGKKRNGLIKKLKKII